MLDGGVVEPSAGLGGGAAEVAASVYRQAFQAVSDAVLVVDAAGILVDANPAVCRRLLLPRSALVGRPFVALFQDADLSRLARMRDRLLRGEPGLGEWSLRRGDGAVELVELDASPLPDRGWLAFVRDASGRRQLDPDLSQAIRARDEFVSIASHELKTPLTTMRLHTDRALRTLHRRGEAFAFAPERMHRFLSVVDGSVSRLTRLVDEMLDIARLGNGKLALSPEPFDLRELVYDVVEKVAPLLARARSRIRIDGDPAHGCWDRFRIDQVLTNLLTNAARYGEGRPIEVKTGVEGGFAQVTVRDQGPGIAPEDQERIFQRFERAQPGLGAGGLGLGLYIARQFVERHGGALTVESHPGQGSTFRIRLPREQAG